MLFAFFLFWGMPVYLYAGVFSFLSIFFDKAEEAIEEITNPDTNSQNIALLQAALNIDPNPSKGGGDITIVGDSALLPDVGPLGTIADVEDHISSDQISVYVVRDGDSLSQIAKMFGVSVNTIIWANDLDRGGFIREGQTLVILPVSGVKYSVKKGDTLGSIAKKFKGDAEEIKSFNNIEDSEDLAVGNEIIIPDGEFGIPTHTAPAYRTPIRGAGGPLYAGYYLKPVFGIRTQGLHGFNGVDLSASYGTPVVASTDGNVLIARPYGWNGGYGAYIVISHGNGTQTLYAHLGSLIVSQGAYVVQGQVIGYAGSSGRSTGPHLHFEVRGAANPF